jgi:mRNA-degrading endonuclease RelE of RelBE toxin-antitoxin system
MEVKFLRQAHKYIKNTKGQLKNNIKEEVDKIMKDPSIGEFLKGKLKTIQAHHFTNKGVNYRIAYQVKNNTIFIMIGTRENFYSDLTKYVDKVNLGS